MQDATKIEEVQFVNTDGTKLTPAQSYMTPFGEVYIAFKTTKGTFLNIPAKEAKNYVIGGYSPQYPL